MPQSIRARLTLVIAALTAILGSLAVFFGMSLVEDRVIEQAVDDQFSPYEEADELFSPDFGEAIEVFEDDLSGGPTAIIEVDDFLEFPIDSEDDNFTDFVWGFDSGQIDELEFFLAQLRRADYPLEQLIENDAGVITVVTDFGIAAPISLVEVNTTTEDSFFFPDEDDTIIPSIELVRMSLTLLEEDAFRRTDAPTVDDEIDYSYETRQAASGRTYGLLIDTTDVGDTVSVLRRVLWFAVFVLVGLAAIATWLLTSRALRPVDAITRQVRGISSGNLAERVPNPGGSDEVSTLATTMNAMLDRIETGDKQRRQFVSDAAHELRTPVAVLRSEAEASLRLPEQTSVEAVSAAVLDESERLATIVEDLLTLARQDERTSVRPPTASGQEVDLEELLLEEAARSRRHPVDLSGVLAGRVIGQADELSRAIGHLLDNAARHAHAQVAVGVAPTSDGGWVELWVDDDGQGVASGDRHQIFERFVRLDEARARDTGGSGLGLAVVKSTVEASGGSVRVVDSPIGGARFLIRLPLAPDQ